MSWNLALARIAGRSEWLLDVLGERLAALVVRALVASPRVTDHRLALRQLDRVPEWLDLLLVWLDRPGGDDLVLPLLDGDSRLAGPYAQVALGEYLSREAQRAMRTDRPADSLWAISLRIARWLRMQPSLGCLHLTWLGPQVSLAAVPEAFRDLARQLESAEQAGAASHFVAEWSVLPVAVEVGQSSASRRWPDSAVRPGPPRVAADEQTRRAA